MAGLFSRLLAVAAASAAAGSCAQVTDVTRESPRQSPRAQAADVRPIEPGPSRPSLVVIFFDDMGWGDLPGFGLEGVAPPEYARELPGFARLAREGARFRHYYSAQPVCSASRASILTGCYPNRIGISGALFPDARIGLADEERTLAELLRERGYATGIFGKWHLGHRPEFNPTRHGFDAYLGIPYSNDMWPPRFSRRDFPKLPLVDGAETVRTIDTLDDQAALTTILTERATRFIRDEARAGRPFFAYLAHPQPHAPIAAGPAFATSERRGLYGAVMRELDWSVGEVLRALDESGVAGSTIVMCTSDNGPWISFGSDAGSTGGLREGKGTTYEGGVRVPCLVRWPGHVPAGATSDVPWMSIDLLATMAAITGAPPPDPGRPIDGRDARGVWSCAPGAAPTHEAFLFYYHDNRLEGVRSGRWKLGLPRSSRTLAGKPGGVDGGETPYVEARVGLELFDLERDPAETTNVAADHPEVVAALMAHVERARADLGDALVNRAGSGRRPPGAAAPEAGERGKRGKTGERRGGAIP